MILQRVFELHTAFATGKIADMGGRSQRSVSHSTGPGRAAYPEDDLTSLRAASSSFTESSRSRSLSSEDGGWHDVGGDDDIEPSDSVSRPPTASSTEAQSRRRRNRHQNSRPASIRRKSSVRVPTIPEESHRSHGGYSERRDHYPEEENSHHIRPREHRVRVPSSGSTTSSVESNEYHMGGGAHYAHPYQQYPPYPHAPQPPQSNYPPTVISSHHSYDAHGHGRTMPPYDAMVPVPRQDAMSPYGYSPSGNPFVTGPSSSNPFSPMPSNVSPPDDYFNPYGRPSPHGGPHHPHAIGRPAPPSRPLSYAGGPYAVDALAHYHQPQFPYPNDPRIIAQLYELNMNRANKSHSASPDPPRSAKSKSPAPAAAPPPAVEPVKEAPKEDQAEILIKLLAKHEADKLAAAEEKAKKEAEAAAAEKAKKDAENTESAKIAAMLQKWEEERQKREADEKAAAEAAKKATEEKAAKEAEIAALVLAAREAANAEAAAKAKAAEEEAAAKTKAIEEESAKAVAAAKAAAEEAEKARKEAEEAVAKAQPSGEDEKACIHFHDAMGRRYDLPWKFAKTFKVSARLSDVVLMFILTNYFVGHGRSYQASSLSYRCRSQKHRRRPLRLNRPGR